MNSSHMQTVPTSPWRRRWQRFSQASIVGFHRYATWLVSISWKRFFLLALLLMITAGILSSIPPFSWRITETIEEVSPSKPRPPSPPQAPQPPREPVIKIEKPAPGAKTEGLDISIDERGIRITPRAASATEAPSGAPAASAPSPSRAASSGLCKTSSAALETGGRTAPLRPRPRPQQPVGPQLPVPRSKS
jgi:hypothetical protein